MNNKNNNTDYLKHNKTYLKIAALLNLKRSSGPCRTVLHYIWRFLLLAIVCISFGAILIDTIHNWRNGFNESVFNYVYLGSLSFIICRTCYYYYFDDKITDLINDVNNTFKYQSETGFEEQDMSTIIYVTKWMCYIWFWSSIVIGEWFIFVPFFFGYYSKKILPVAGWYPYDCTVTPYYEMTVFLQLFNQTAMIFLTPTTDSFYVSICVMVAKQFEILGWELKNLIYSNLLRHGISKDIVVEFKDEMSISHHKRYFPDGAVEDKRWEEFSKICNVIYSNDFQNDLLKHFHNLVKFHKSLLWLIANMESFYSPLALIYFVPVLLCFMSFAYIITTTSDIVVLTEDVVATGWLLLEVMLLCYFPELIAEKTEEMRFCLYDFPWYYCNNKFMNSFKIMHQRTNKPVMLTVGKFTMLGLNMFTWTVKVSYSFTAVVRRMNYRN